MNTVSSSVIIIVFLFGIALYLSQQKLRNKMLCTFVRSNKTKIEAWVPIDSTQVVWDKGRSGYARYYINPDDIIMQWYARGINRFFPVLIPTLEFRWNSPFTVNQMTGETTWLTPEALNASWEEHQHKAYAQATQQATGKKGRFPDWLVPVATVGLLLIVLYIVWQGMAGLDLRMFNLEQQLKLILP